MRTAKAISDLPDRASFRSLLSAAFLAAFSFLQIAFIKDFIPFPAEGRFRWDGGVYARVAQVFPHLSGDRLLEDGRPLNTFQAQRILPSILVHYLLSVLGLGYTNNEVFLGFEIYNALLLCLSTTVYFSLARSLHFGRRLSWLGFAGLYGSFAILKMNYYYPNLTDTTAFVLGLALLYAYLRGSSVGVLVCGMAGAFAWPILWYFAGILFIFPRDLPVRRSERDGYRYGLAALAVVGFGAAIAVSGVIREIFVEGIRRTIGAGTAAIDPKLFVASVATSAAAMALVVAGLFRGVGLENVRCLWARRTIWRSLVFALVLGCLMVAHSRIGGPGEPGGTTVKMVLGRAALSSIIEPAIFWVGHVIYFGPVVLLATIFLSGLMIQIKSLGLGFFLLACLNALLFFNAESRWWIAFVPAFVLVTMMALQEVRLSGQMLAVFGALALVLSKVWIRIGDPRDFYFMNFGPWMQKRWYLIQMAVCVGSYVVLRLVTVRGRRATGSGVRLCE